MGLLANPRHERFAQDLAAGRQPNLVRSLAQVHRYCFIVCPASKVASCTPNANFRFNLN